MPVNNNDNFINTYVYISLVVGQMKYLFKNQSFTYRCTFVRNTLCLEVHICSPNCKYQEI